MAVTAEIPVGSRVRHRLMGPGDVLATRYRGYEYWVQFKAVKAWVRGPELIWDPPAGGKVDPNRVGRPVSRSMPVDSDGPSHRMSLPSTARRVEAGHAERAVIESFRLGTVPDAYVEQWTEGRDDELAHLRHWLSDQADGSLLIEGAYGSGKSHLLQTLRARALSEGWAVSYSHLDAGEESAAFSKRLYRQIARGLEVPGIGKLEHALLAAVDASAENPAPDHPILGNVLDRIRRGTMRPDDWEAVLGTGEATAVTGFLPDFTTSANVYCNLLSGLGYLMSEVLGKRGMLILVDEVETASACLYRFHFTRAQSFFRGLTLTASDDPALLDEAVEKGKTSYVGATTGLIYAGHRKIPYLYRIPSGLKVVLATTPGPMRGQYKEWRSEQSVLEIDTLRPRALRTLMERLNQTYGALHGVSFPELTVTALTAKLLDRFGGLATRRVIKAFVECLDFRRFNPGQPLKDIL